ncbi:MAG TPA: sigma-54 dependent transcriptional regulator, partial [Thermodesulfobacteriota bacterium]|nr:sigma-54 dependent transcriptional regulator [Thermodesulfobacteriota bacterium]
MQKILVIDDEKGIRDSLSMIFGIEGYMAVSVDNAKAGLSLIDEGERYDFIICDIKLPGMGGMEFLEEIRERDLAPVIIMISAYGTVENSIEAIKKGADDYINKPIVTEELILRMKMAEERRRLRQRTEYLEREIGSRKEFGDIIFASVRMEDVIRLAEKAGQYKTTVLISGESGTGKELIAKAIHNGSPRRDAPFIAVNCAAIPETLLESELFGYAKGAFSGADGSKRGLIEEAHGGTLFLDEIGEFPLTLQPKLLRVLQEGEIRRLGDTGLIKTDIRIIAATSRDLARETERGRFRNDLYYRLNVLPIIIPPLRERKEDILPLVRYFIAKYNRRLNRRITDATPEAMSEIMGYDWPGNVRELENAVERAMILSDSEYIQKIDIGTTSSKQGPGAESWIGTLTYEEARHRIEKSYIEKALAESRGNRTKAAKILGISRRSLLYKLKEQKEN